MSAAYDVMNTQQERPERHLSLQSRPSSTNLFARLSPKVARELFQEAIASQVDEVTNGWQASDATWSLDEGCTSGVEFLPLQIVLKDGTTVYASYNGGSIDSDEIIELPGDAIPSFSVAVSDTFVTVSALSFVADAVRIAVDPVSPRDWELLELYAGFLENDSLLNQVSVIYPGQIISLSVGAGSTDRAKVCVKDTGFKGCQRLVADTEITVAPKARPTSLSPSQAFRLVGTNDDWPGHMKTLAEQEGLQLLTVSPGTMLVHPTTMNTKIPGWKEAKNCQHAVVWRDITDATKGEDDRSGNGGTIVKIQVTESIGIDLVALHILNRYSINAMILLDMVRIQLLPLETVNRIRLRTQQSIMQNELTVSLHKVNEMRPEDTSRKAWRCTDHKLLDEPSLTIHLLTSMRNAGEEMFLTHGSMFVLAGEETKIYNRHLTQTKFEMRSKLTTIKNDCYRVPLYIVTINELEGKNVPLTLDYSQPDDEQSNLKRVAAHYRRTTDSIWTNLLLETSNSYDAWIFSGDVGTGKTHCSQIFAAVARMKWHLPSFYLNCKKLQSSHDLRMNSTLQELTQVFREAKASNRSILILDDLDHIAVNTGNAGNGDNSNQEQINPIAVDQSKMLSNHIQTLMEQCQGSMIFVITCHATKDLAPEILDAVPCNKLIEIEALRPAERNGMLRSMISLGLKASLDRLSPLSDGYCARDLEVVCTRAKHQPDHATNFDKALRTVMNDYVPLSRQGVVSETLNTVHDWNDDVGGLFEAKEKLKDTILDPIKYRRIYAQLPIKLPKGILLFGPPGCGKTFLVPALARECGHTLITCRGPELLDRYIGASEANVRRLFERAKSVAPSILFLDEFDALAPRRGSDHTGVTDRVVNQLLTYLDGVETTLAGVFVIAATSRPDKVDPALLRPGRLEQHVYVGFPASSEELNDVLTKMMSERKIVDVHLVDSVGTGLFPLSPEEEELLAQFSPADIKAVLDTAQLEAIHQHLEASTSLPPTPVLTISEHHLRQALLSTRPSVSVQDRAMLDHIYQPFLGTLTRDSYVKKAGPTSQEMITALK